MLDTVQFLIGCIEPGEWWAEVSHSQQMKPVTGQAMDWVRDTYRFDGIGAVSDEVMGEMSSLIAELMGYSAERIVGLQLQLF